MLPVCYNRYHLRYARYIIYSPDWGIYLGEFMGMGFWSKLDPAGQVGACTFTSRLEIDAIVAEWKSKPSSYESRSVECNHPDYATIQECVDAGLPAWEAK